MTEFDIYIFSHKEDPDGIISAALIKSYLLRMGVEEKSIFTVLVNYRDFPDKFKKILPQIDRICLFITDLGLNSELIEIYGSLTDIIPHSGETTGFKLAAGNRYYIDHHKIPRKEILELIRSKFHQYLNPMAENVELLGNSLHYCTADILNKYLNPNLRAEQRAHSGNITKFAHITDFVDESRDNPEYPIELIKNAEAIKNYISYHQTDETELIRLTDNLVSLTKWDTFQPKYLEKLSVINNWIRQQILEIETSIQIIRVCNTEVVHAVAHIRPGFISRYLDTHYPGKDLYVGLSSEHRYLNIHTKKSIAHKIARKMGGGGHKYRAGFKLPEKWSSSWIDCIPDELLKILAELYCKIE